MSHRDLFVPTLPKIIFILDNFLKVFILIAFFFTIVGTLVYPNKEVVCVCITFSNILNA